MTTTASIDRLAVRAVALDMREAFVTAAIDILDADLSTVVVLADISVGSFEAAAARHPERVVNVGIREQLAVSVGAGIALSGMRPIVHTIAPFLVERAFEQIKLDFAHQGVGGVLVSVGASFDYASSGRTHQAPEDVALLRTLPGIAIHVPGHPDELVQLLRREVRGTGTAYIRASTQSNRTALPTGAMQLVRPGARGTVIAVGPLLDSVLAAVEGLDLTVLYTSTVRPFDRVAVAATLTRPDVVLVEPYLVGTSAAEVSTALRDVPHRLLSLGVPAVELRRYGTAEEHAAAYGLDAASLRRDIVGFLGEPR